jgi:phosphatidylethanolamine N-methyltransferase
MAESSDQLRQRHVAQAAAEQEGHPDSNDVENRTVANDEDHTKQQKTYGRTPEGTGNCSRAPQRFCNADQQLAAVFQVPTTHDMVSQLLDPRQPKNISDAVVLVILALHVLLAYWLPPSLKRPVFAAVYILWRTAYNLGIGILLRQQSKYRLLETWAKRWKLFEPPSSGKNPRPWLYKVLKRELEAKIPQDYEFEEAPLEYNTWLVFRRVVDLILMCDFISYCLFAIVCSHKPDGESILMTVARWSVGVALFGFNLWVKLDAHRVVKDYAWYWGDFFYLIDQDLTFDGVFEMAPHPMYSIGYAGYYGISAMAASYQVLFISIAAHLAQFAFLVWVENPHIDKTYNPPAPRKRTASEPGSKPSEADGRPDPLTPSPVHGLLGFRNLDLFRTTDYTLIWLLSYLAVITLVTPRTRIWQTIFVAHALIWRIWYSFGLGVILHFQSQEKMFTRHFVKFGESAGEAWRQWKGMYHLSMWLCHASFIAACWKMYTFPDDWEYGWVLLKHVIGLGLIALQFWTARSIYESLGEFGWFYGDFFFDNGGKLTYTSIYRFLNNPERVLGTAGLWGAALITWSRAIFLLAMTAQLLTLAFLNFVESPHMQKRYGRKIREEAGLTKFIKKSLPPPVKDWQTSVDKVLDETRQLVHEFMEAARPRLAAGYTHIVRDTTAMLNAYPARLTITRVAPDLAGINPRDYSLSIEGQPATSRVEATASTQERLGLASSNETKSTLVLEYGAPIRVKWTAPTSHSKKDWVGLYKVADNRSREVTELASFGRWVPTCPGQFDTATDVGIISSDRPVREGSGSDEGSVQGEMLFEGDKLWWTEGTFEFRYHHDGNHNVVSISQPFEIRISRFDEDDVEVDANGDIQRAVEAALLPVVRNCLDRDPEIAPNSIDESFGSLVERDGKYARRVVYAIKHMFGIEFAPAVVPADGNVRKLSWRICNAKLVLVGVLFSPSVPHVDCQLTQFACRRPIACQRRKVLIHQPRRSFRLHRMLQGDTELPRSVKAWLLEIMA